MRKKMSHKIFTAAGGIQQIRSFQRKSGSGRKEELTKRAKLILKGSV